MARGLRQAEPQPSGWPVALPGLAFEVLVCVLQVTMCEGQMGCQSHRLPPFQAHTQRVQRTRASRDVPERLLSNHVSFLPTRHAPASQKASSTTTRSDPSNRASVPSHK